MANLFTSAKSVLRRANHHITELKSAAIQTFTRDKPYTYRVDYDSEAGKYIHKAIFSEEFSDDISCIMFDAINNLRACLDQMTYAIATKHRGRENKFSSFPFASNETEWPNAIKRLKNNVPAEIIAIFEGFKPYKGGNDTLWALNYIANIKKHAILIPAGFGAALVSVPMQLGSPEFEFAREPFNADGNEIELLRSQHANFGAQIQFTYTVVIRHSEEIINGQSPITLLDAISAEVRRVLVNTEAECRRIRLTSG
jgi:hypothetical protein